MLFLTYHVIVAGDTVATDGVFSVGASALEAHVQCLAERQFSAGALAPFLAGAGSQKSFLLTFDDGTADHYELVAPLLERHGLRGVFFVPTEKIGLPGRLTREQLQELHARGHEIGCHSHAHRRLDVLSVGEIAHQLTTSCDLLEEITGQRPRILAPPGGYTSARIRAAALNAGLAAVRTMKWGVNQRLKLDDLETIALHRDFPVARLAKILDGRGLWKFRALYLCKQMLKSFLPISLYERTRNLVFRK